ncbi:AsnC family transcriptional regulator, partial [Streptomyces sp. SID7499]|nr:AsnC family transcriptional regulator [Streptomyces sp. SID7499]
MHGGCVASRSADSRTGNGSPPAVD